jgi:hypothetical protein
VGPFGSFDRAFDYHTVDLMVVFSLLLLVLEVQVGASSDRVNGFKGWEIIAFLRRLWVYWAPFFVVLHMCYGGYVICSGGGG